MGKVVSASEFDRRFARMIDELAQDGEPVTIIRDGQVVATLTVPAAQKPDAQRSVIGMLHSSEYRDNCDPNEPACPPDNWEALR